MNLNNRHNLIIRVLGVLGVAVTSALFVAPNVLAQSNTDSEPFEALIAQEEQQEQPEFDTQQQQEQPDADNDVGAEDDVDDDGVRALW